MTLYIKPISALLTHDTQMFSNMDPYVVLKLGSQKRRSKTHKEGGKKPKWSQVLTFKTNNPTKLEITVMDEDTVTDDVVGSGTLDLLKYVNTLGQNKQYVNLSYKNRSAGKICLSIRYQSSNSSNNNSQPGIGMNQGNSGWQQPPQPGSAWGSQPNQSGWSNPQPNSGWGQQQPQQNSGWAQPPNMFNQPPPNPNSGNAFGILGQALQNDIKSPQNSGWQSNNNGWNQNQNNNSGWGQNQNNNNNGWGQNNNGWGNSGGNGW